MEFAGAELPVSSALLTRYAILLKVHGVEVSDRGAMLVDPPGEGRMFSVFRGKDEDIRAVVELVSAGVAPEKAAQGLPAGATASEVSHKPISSKPVQRR